MEGPLSKWTNVMQGWQYRWFVLDENVALLSYYTSKDKMKRGSRRGCVRLKGAVLGIDDEEESTFTITTIDQKTFHFQARDGEERQKWMEALEESISRASTPRGHSPKHVPSSAAFDKKLAETDAYLQLLISQAKSLEEKINVCDDEASKEKYSVIKVTAEAMIESVKHAIVMMQLAKPRYMIEDDESRYNETGQDSTSESDLNFMVTSARNTQSSEVDDKESDGVELQEDNESHGQDRSPSARSIASHSTRNREMDVPMNSYSSSDDDDFYDAFETSNQSTKSVKEDDVEREDIKQSPPIIASQNDVPDELYDDCDEEALESLSAHGSIIKHLLSQVRIGMDLTKIVLPTFILERRSLLEMFADFFSHPDLFVSHDVEFNQLQTYTIACSQLRSSLTTPVFPQNSGLPSQLQAFPHDFRLSVNPIGDYSSPEERITEVLRWYMSAFHAGRKSSVAKKPYNPILGETFLCFWDIPNFSSSEMPPADDGPVKWASTSHLCYIAEQVSHHPPISAFYAECQKKRIALDGYIWTKSKFLGLSIGVHMIGQAAISLLDWEEEYKITFPSGYGRSILTVPWIELGGKCQISCEKTGYSAVVDFLTKPFYGGKTNQIKGQVFEPNNTKPICNVTGEWNGVMWAEYSSGRSEVFCDTTKIPIVKKRVKQISEQDPFESRRLWKDVTLNLKKKDVQEATKYKQALEQRQREEAKLRAETGAPIKHKHFQEVGEHWVYTDPLTQRVRDTDTASAAAPDTASAAAPDSL